MDFWRWLVRLIKKRQPTRLIRDAAPAVHGSAIPIRGQKVSGDGRALRDIDAGG